MPEIPVARGERIPWEAAPDRVRAAVEAFLGERVGQATTQPLGFSPAVAARLVTVTGTRAFVKACPPEPNPDTPELYRREIEVNLRLPAGLPAPQLLWSLDEGPGGWVVLLFEDLDGSQPALPWRAPELALAVAAIDEIADKLTPSPLSAGQQGERIQAGWIRWHEWEASPPAGIDPWLRSNLPRLAALEATVAEATRGDTLVHLDVRSDNLVITGGRCWITDWAWPLRGAPWMDIALFACFVESEGGPPAEQVLAASRVGRAAPAEGVIALLAAFGGMLTVQATSPPPPGLPKLREFQSVHARTAVRWLRRLL